jgi:hypothetical protein
MITYFIDYLEQEQLPVKEMWTSTSTKQEQLPVKLKYKDTQ